MLKDELIAFNGELTSKLEKKLLDIGKLEKDIEDMLNSIGNVNETAEAEASEEAISIVASQGVSQPIEHIPDSDMFFNFSSLPKERAARIVALRQKLQSMNKGK